MDRWTNGPTKWVDVAQQATKNDQQKNNRQNITVCFFWFVTLHDDIAQPPGMQNSSAMAHFVDNK